MSDLLGSPVRLAVEVVHSFGYPGVFDLMVLSNVPLPMPSEAILPLAGCLAGQGRFALPLLLVVAATG